MYLSVFVVWIGGLLCCEVLIGVDDLLADGFGMDDLLADGLGMDDLLADGFGVDDFGFVGVVWCCYDLSGVVVTRLNIGSGRLDHLIC